MASESQVVRKVAIVYCWSFSMDKCEMRPELMGSYSAQ